MITEVFFWLTCYVACCAEQMASPQDVRVCCVCLATTRSTSAAAVLASLSGVRVVLKNTSVLMLVVWQNSGGCVCCCCFYLLLLLYPCRHERATQIRDRTSLSVLVCCCLILVLILRVEASNSNYRNTCFHTASIFACVMAFCLPLITVDILKMGNNIYGGEVVDLANSGAQMADDGKQSRPDHRHRT